MSGGARVLIEQAPGQTRALHLDGDRVVESWHDFRHDPDRTGSVHAVRIDRVFAAQNRATATLVDYNRAGVPLVEIVSRPDMHDAESARAYVAELRDILLARSGSSRCSSTGSSL